MKKTLLLSIAASAVLFAGGDIKEVIIPEEVEVIPCPTSNLKWYGQTVLYYQTREVGNAIANFELFDGDVSAANAGLKLGVVGSNLADTGIGFGVEIVALGSLGLEKDGDAATAAEIAAAAAAGFAYTGGIVNDFVDATMQTTDVGDLNGGALTQAYLTYTAGNTTAKVGRMYLPKNLSPFAFSEKWNVFSNSFEAAVLVNTDIADTTLVGAYVTRANGINNLGAWGDVAGNDDGAFMLTAVNKSVAGLTLTGTVYFLPEFTPTDDAIVLWGDAKFSTKVAGNTINVAAQGGTLDIGLADATIAYGVKAGGNFAIPAFGNVALCAAYSGVDLQTAGNLAVRNVGTFNKTPLYTQMVANQGQISGAVSGGTADTVMIKGSATYDLPAIGSTTLSVGYGMTTRENIGGFDINDYNELDVIAKTKIGNATVLAAYVATEVDDGNGATDADIVRVWAKWNF